MDPLTEANLRICDARIRRDKREQRRAEKAFKKLQHPSIARLWWYHFREKLLPPRNLQKEIDTALANSLRRRR